MKKIFIFVFLAAFSLVPSSLYAQGTLNGRVIFEGTPPASETIEVKSDVATCGHPKEIRKMIVGQDQGVGNVLVRIIGAEGTLEAKDGFLDQIKCEFIPHVQVVPFGSKLKITSSDPVLHNAHGFFEDGKTAFNIAVPIAGMEVPALLKKSGIIKLRCDAGHTWMSGYVIVTETPYYALTDENGNFSITGIPPGDYEIEIWQEWSGARREPVTVADGEQTATFKLESPQTA